MSTHEPIYDMDYIKNQNGKYEIQKYIKNYYRKRPLEVLFIKNGIILPQKEADKKAYPNTWMGLGGVLDQNDTFIKMSGIKALYYDDLVFGGKYDYKEPIEKCNETILYMGAFQPQWGHFLVEYCTRLWYSIKQNNKYKIAYCGFACEPGEIQRPFQEFLNLLGIKYEQLIDIRKPTKYTEIIIPEQSFLRNQYYTDEYKFIVDTAYKNINTKGLIPYERIYFSRDLFIKNTGTTREFGEKEIQNTFKKNGYKILMPEMLSVREQIFYMRNCKEFVASLGSISDNAVFSADGCKKIYIKKAFSIIPEMFQIEQMVMSEKITFIDCYYKPYKDFPLDYGRGPHFIGATKEFIKFLKANHMQQLSKITYNTALLKTWIWLIKIFIKRKTYVYKEKINLLKINFIIDTLLKQKIRKFIIYPYGKIGNIVKNILDEKGIDSYIIVDHYKCLLDKMICDVDILNDMRYHDYIVLVCCDIKNRHYNDIKNTVYDLIEKEQRIVEVKVSYIF